MLFRLTLKTHESSVDLSLHKSISGYWRNNTSLLACGKLFKMDTFLWNIEIILIFVIKY